LFSRLNMANKHDVLLENCIFAETVRNSKVLMCNGICRRLKYTWVSDHIEKSPHVFYLASAEVNQ
jgi:hypothetical protein